MHGTINIKLTNSLINIFTYMATSFDPQLGSSSGHNTRTLNMYRNFVKRESVVVMNI